MAEEIRNENKVEIENSDPEVETSAPETAQQQEQEDPIQQILSKARNAFIENIYNSIDYRNMFQAIGQPDQYDVFKEWADEYEKEAEAIDAERKALYEGQKTPEQQDLDAVNAKEERLKKRLLTWHEFLKDTPISAQQVGIILDQIISLIIHISLGASQVISSAIYDTVIASQFMNVQKQHEQFVAAIGQLNKSVDDLNALHQAGPADDADAENDQSPDSE